MRYFLQKVLSNKTLSDLSNFIENHQHGHLFQHPSWTVIQKSSPLLPFLYFWGEESGKIRIAALIRRHRLPGLGWAKDSISRGPVCDDQEVLQEGILNLITLLKKKGSVSIQLNPFWPQPEADLIEKKLSSAGFSPLPLEQGLYSSTLIIDLNQDEEEIFRGFRRFTRQKINKAYKNGLEVAPANNENDIHVFWELYDKLAVEKHMRQIPELFFIKLWRTLIENKDKGVFLITRYQDEIVSGLLVLKHNARAIAHYSASEFQKFPKLAKSQPTHWEAIKWAKTNQCTVYDLGGYQPGALEGSPLYGVNQFKRGFSKKQEEFVRDHLYIISPARYRLLSWLERLKNGSLS